MSIKLSILICSLADRADKLAAMMRVLEPQKTPEIEILVETDSGELPIGEKRNILLDRARGGYIAYVDDDDLVSENYVCSILSAIESRPDCVGIVGIMCTADENFVFKHSIEFAGWYEYKDVFYRTPNHLNPIKTDIARMVGFDSSKSHGEDADYSREIRQYLHTEKFISEPIYYYNQVHLKFKRVQKL